MGTNTESTNTASTNVESSSTEGAESDTKDETETEEIQTIRDLLLEEWIDVELDLDDFSKFDCDGDGYCDTTNFCLRNAKGTAYIDHITVELREADTVTATDDKDGEISPEIIWSEGALDRRGRLVEGEHTLTVIATDFSGNEKVTVIPVIVTEELPEVQ